MEDRDGSSSTDGGTAVNSPARVGAGAEAVGLVGPGLGGSDAALGADKDKDSPVPLPVVCGPEAGSVNGSGTGGGWEDWEGSEGRAAEGTAPSKGVATTLVGNE